jgi:endonuclease YncB( thermonuclease family)
MKGWQIFSIHAVVAVAIAAVASCCGPKLAAGISGEVVRVIDGDTIDVNLLGEVERVRLLRIDTPEVGEAGHAAATRSLKDLVGGRRVLVEFERPGVLERGKYGRVLGYVVVDGLNVNIEMVRQGHSDFYTKYGRGRYAEQFEAAVAARE